MNHSHLSELREIYEIADFSAQTERLDTSDADSSLLPSVGMDLPGNMLLFIAVI